MLTDARDALAARQARLVRALVGLEHCPAGFDVEQIAMTGLSLASKRARAAAKAWPDFSSAIGEQFESLFAEYAQTEPAPPTSGPTEDGFRFADFLAERDRLSMASRQIWLAMRLHYRRTEAGIKSRRGLAIVWDRRPGIWWLRIGLRWRRSWEFWL